MRNHFLLATSLGAIALASAPARAQVPVAPEAARPGAPVAATAQPASGQTTDTRPANDQPAVGASNPTPPNNQTVPGSDSSTPAADNEAIVVTGSRIARPNLQSTVPITTLTGAEFYQTGQVSVGDRLTNLIPALIPTFTTANSTRFLGTAGLNLLDLRGLGTQRTLVLVNGRRHVAADILNNAVSADTNTFPTDLIERVDVVTGGNSAVYGSDAIAGVVNFVLKDKFNGLQLRGQSGISELGDAATYYGSLLAGKNFAEGRGNVAVNLEYARQNEYFGVNRRNLRQNDGFVVVDTDPAGTPNGSDGAPDRLFLRDIRSSTLSNGGQLGFNSGRNLFPNGAPNPNAGVCGRDAAGNPFNCTFLFQPDGTLVPQTGLRTGIAPNGSFIGGNGTSFREGEQFQLSPKTERYVANVVAHFDLTPAITPFIEAKFARLDTLGTGSSGPAFFQGATLDGDRERPRLDNPFLSPQARSLITSQLLAANPAAVITDATQFSLRENLLGLGQRTEEARRETYRIVGGVRGTFLRGWKYELTANYGRFEESTKVLGNLNIQRFLLAADAARAPGGQIVCRSRIDPNAAIPIVEDAAVLARDVQECVPINLFGEGNISPEARRYVLTDTTSKGRITQFVANGFVSGNTGGFFELPGGPIGFSLGAEYRRETAYFQADPLVQQGFTFYNALPTFGAPAFEVAEGFGEIRLPIVKDLPLLHSLEISGAGRVAGYNFNTGIVYAYSGGFDWFPVRDVHIRGNYSRAVRAPNLSELFSAQSQNFATVNDPCSARNIGTGSATRAANCASQGIPASYDYVYVQSLEILSGGNPNLNAETSDSYTLGAVVQPRWVRGLSMSADYFNVQVDKVIATPSAQQILDSCYDQATTANQFCSLFQRAGAGGGPGGEEPFRVIEGSLQQTLLNYAKSRVRGIDAQIGYNRSFGANTRLDLRGVFTHYLTRTDFLNPVDPARGDRLLTELVFPEDRGSFTANLKLGGVSLNYQFRYIGKAVLNQYEDFFSFQGRDPQNADYASRKFYPAITYHNLRFGVDIGKHSEFYVGADNIADQMPPLGLSGIGGGSGIYDNRGRFFYAGFRVGL